MNRLEFGNCGREGCLRGCKLLDKALRAISTFLTTHYEGNVNALVQIDSELAKYFVDQGYNWGNPLATRDPDSDYIPINRYSPKKKEPEKEESTARTQEIVDLPIKPPEWVDVDVTDELITGLSSQDKVTAILPPIYPDARMTIAVGKGVADILPGGKVNYRPLVDKEVLNLIVDRDVEFLFQANMSVTVHKGERIVHRSRNKMNGQWDALHQKSLNSGRGVVQTPQGIYFISREGNVVRMTPWEPFMETTLDSVTKAVDLYASGEKVYALQQDGVLISLARSKYVILPNLDCKWATLGGINKYIVATGWNRTTSTNFAVLISPALALHTPVSLHATPNWPILRLHTLSSSLLLCIRESFHADLLCLCAGNVLTKACDFPMTDIGEKSWIYCCKEIGGELYIGIQGGIRKVKINFSF